MFLLKKFQRNNILKIVGFRVIILLHLSTAERIFKNMLKNELRNKLIFDRLIGMMLVGDLRKKYLCGNNEPICK